MGMPRDTWVEYGDLHDRDPHPGVVVTFIDLGPSQIQGIGTERD